MKEAAGEANLTVIAIILIGIVMAVAVPLIQGMMKTVEDRSVCTNNGGSWINGQCDMSQAN